MQQESSNMTGEAALLIRADATASMGTGHAMRCLSLAQAWQDAGGFCIFAMADVTPAVRQRIEAEHCEVVTMQGTAGSVADSDQIAGLARERKISKVVVDGYQFGADYQRSLKSAGLETLYIDDYGQADHYTADIVLNQNVSAGERLYPNRESHTRLLLGPRYALLRREFTIWRNSARNIPSIARKVLITLGGSDPENLTTAALESLASVKLENLEAVVVVGGSNPNFESLRHAGLKLADQRSMKVDVRRDVTNIAELMAWADIAISAAGSTCWEFCLLGLPALLMDVAKNQTAVARELDRLQCAVHVGSAQDVSVERLGRELERLLESQALRETLSARSRELVDGEGARRVVSALQSKEGIHLRPAREEDSRLLFEWASDPEVRASAFSSASISWEHHAQWFAAKMKDPDCRILIAEDERGKPIGQFRVDWRGPENGEIDVSVSRGCRGRGYGSKIVHLGVEAAFEGRSTDANVLHAYVKLENDASQRAFESAGFRSLGEKNVNGHRTVHYVCSKEQS
jgi:UDP-2,4-diacetamido-2,4,6-trideoxy-beta-L-altropyranose hydrolase